MLPFPSCAQHPYSLIVSYSFVRVVDCFLRGRRQLVADAVLRGRLHGVRVGCAARDRLGERGVACWYRNTSLHENYLLLVVRVRQYAMITFLGPHSVICLLSRASGT